MNSTRTIAKSPSLRKKLQSIVEDEDVKILLLACMEQMGPYKKESGFKEIPHQQSMISGGREAIDMFVKRFRSLPYMDQESEDARIDFDTSPTLHDLV